MFESPISEWCSEPSDGRESGIPKYGSLDIIIKSSLVSAMSREAFGVRLGLRRVRWDLELELEDIC